MPTSVSVHSRYNRILLAALGGILSSAVCQGQHHGVVTGSPNYTTGKFGNAIGSFSTSNYVTLPAGASNFPNSSYTVEAWVRTSSAAWQSITHTETSTTKSLNLYVSGTGTGAWYGGNNNGALGGVVSDGNWHHMAGTCNGSTAQLYVDGVRVATIATTCVAPNLPIAVGTHANRIWDINNGRIDELAIWNGVRYTGSTLTVPTAAYLGNEPNLRALYHFDSNANDSAGAGGLSGESYDADFPLETIPTLSAGQCYKNAYASSGSSGNYVCQLTPPGYHHRYTEPLPANPTGVWLLVDGAITSNLAGPTGLTPNTGTYFVHLGPRTGNTKQVSAPMGLPQNTLTTAQMTGSQLWNPGEPNNPANPLNYELYQTSSSIPNARTEQKLWKLRCIANCTAPTATWAWSLVKDFTGLIDWNNDAWCMANCDPGNSARSYAGAVDNFGPVSDIRNYASNGVAAVSLDGNRVFMDLRTKTKQNHAVIVWTKNPTTDCPSGDCTWIHYANAQGGVVSDPTLPNPPGYVFTGPFGVPWDGNALLLQMVHPDQRAFALRAAIKPLANGKFAPHASAVAGGLESMTGDGSINGIIGHGATLRTGVAMAGGAAAYGTMSAPHLGTPNWVTTIRSYSDLSTSTRTNATYGFPYLTTFGIPQSDFLGGLHMSSSPYNPNWVFALFYKEKGRYGTHTSTPFPDGNSKGYEIIAIRTNQAYALPTHPAPWPSTGFVRLGQHNSCVGDSYNVSGIEYARGCKGGGYTTEGHPSPSFKGDAVFFDSAWSRQSLNFAIIPSTAYNNAPHVVPRVMMIEVPPAVTEGTGLVISPSVLGVTAAGTNGGFPYTIASPPGITSVTQTMTPGMSSWVSSGFPAGCVGGSAIYGCLWVSPNTGAPRTGTITFTSTSGLTGTMTINQDSTAVTPGTVTVVPATISVPAVGGAYRFDITSPTGVTSASVASPVSWIGPAFPATCAGGTQTYGCVWVNANTTGTARTSNFTVTLPGHLQGSVTISQAAN